MKLYFKKRCAFHPYETYCCCTGDGCNDSELGMRGRLVETPLSTGGSSNITSQLPSSPSPLKCYQVLRI